MIRFTMILASLFALSFEASAMTNFYVMTCSGHSMETGAASTLTVTLDMAGIEKNWQTSGLLYVQGTGQVDVDGFVTDAIVTFVSDSIFGAPLSVATSPIPDAELSVDANVVNQFVAIAREGTSDVWQNVSCSSNIGAKSEGQGLR